MKKLLKVKKIKGGTIINGIFFRKEMESFDYIITDSNYKFPISYGGWHWYNWMLKINNKLEII